MNVRIYALVTAAYWAFTVTDGALRMLVLLHFHELGYSPVSLSLLFLLYEVLGVATNFVGGRLGGRFGLNRTLVVGLATQVAALLLLSLQNPDWVQWFSVLFVMATQALSGVAKDLTKLSAKASLKIVVPDDGGQLFRWVAVLTGSKNALKGVGFFVGGALLASIGFAPALRSMAAGLAVILALVAVGLGDGLGREAAVVAAKGATAARSWLSDSAGLNRLATARLFLFASRDVWFVVAVPVFLTEQLGWSFGAVGSFMALWVIGYGVVQSIAPSVATSGRAVRAARWWIGALCITTVSLAALVWLLDQPAAVVIVGLMAFGMIFAVNSSIHSFLVLAYADRDSVSADVGFYYSANAVGRLAGTLASGAAYAVGGLAAALGVAASLLVIAAVTTRRLPALPANLATGSDGEIGTGRSAIDRAQG